MNNRKILLFAGSAFCALTMPAYAQDAPQGAESPSSIDDIIVTARRQSEALSKVPVAVTALSQEDLSARGTYSVQDMQQDVPGLTVTPTTADRNNVVYSIRGQGYAYGTLFPAVITYFQEVPVANFSSGQFFDLENLQVLRGPQGVQFGRVTDGGNIMVAPHKPTGEFGGSIEARYGNLDMKAVTGVLNVPIAGDKLALRGAFEIMRRDGFMVNEFNGQKLDNTKYETYRLGVLIRPAEGIENYTVVQYQRTHDNGTSVHLSGLNTAGLTNSLNGLIGPTGLFSGGLVGAGAFVAGQAAAADPGNAALAAFASSLAGAYMGPLYGLDAQGDIVGFGSAGMVSPLTLDNYLASQQSQLARSQALGPRRVNYTSPSFDRRKNLYVVNVTDIDLADTIQLKNVFGYIRATQKQASNFTGSNGNLVVTPHSGINFFGGVSPEPGNGLDFFSQEQISNEVRLSGQTFSDSLNWSLGFYYDRQKPATSQQNDTINVAVLQRVNVPINKTESKAIYGALEYDASSLVEGLKINGGLRYTWDSVKARTVTYLRPLSFPVVTGGTTLDAATAFASVIQAATYLGSGGTVMLTPEQALAAAQATFAPIPHGECVSYGGPLFPADCATFNRKFEAFTWSGGLSYQADPGTMLYAKMSKGYRPGGVQASSIPGSETYDPEFDYSIEAGVKARFDLGGGAQGRASLAVYRDRYKDIQKLIAVAGAGGTPVSIITNAAAGTIKGIEFEGTLIPVPGLTLDATAAYTDAKYDHADPVDPTRNPCDPTSNAILGFCTDNRFANTPKFQYSLAAHYAWDLPGDMGSVRFGGRFYHQSSVAMTDFSTLAIGSIEPSYGLLDLDARWSNVGGQPITISLFMNNVTNKLYRQGNDNLNYASSVGVNGDIYAPPRTYGIALKYSFGGEAD